MPAFLFDDRQSRQGTRMILFILLGVDVLHARFIVDDFKLPLFQK